MKTTVLSAINRAPTAKLPYNIELTSEKRKAFCAEMGIAEGDYFAWAGNHIEKADYITGAPAEQPGHYRDCFGVVWNRCQWGPRSWCQRR